MGKNKIYSWLLMLCLTILWSAFWAFICAICVYFLLKFLAFQPHVAKGLTCAFGGLCFVAVFALSYADIMRLLKRME